MSPSKTAIAVSIGILLVMQHATSAQQAGVSQGARPSPEPLQPYSSANTVAYTTSMEVLNDKRKLGPGDRVSFRVVEDRKQPVQLVVTDSGEMEVPLVGRVPAAEKTLQATGLRHQGTAREGILLPGHRDPRSGQSQRQIAWQDLSHGPDPRPGRHGPSRG